MGIGSAIAYITLYVLFGLLGMFFAFKPAIEKYEQTLLLKYNQIPFPYILLFFVISSVSAYFLLPAKDFVENLTLIRVVVPLIFAAAIFLSQFMLERIGQWLVIIVAVAVDVYLQPIGIGNPFPELPIWFTRLILVAGFSIFCIKADILNVVPHTFITSNILILLGICVLTAVSASPLYVCVCSASLIGILIAYLSFNFQSVKIGFDSLSCSALAFLVAHLLLLNLGEFSFSSCMIFTVIFWSEFLVALWNRFIITHEQSLMENTNYYKAAQKYDAKSLVMNIMKIGIVILFIAWFQLFAKNHYSLMIVATLIAIWLNNSLGNDNMRTKKFKELNQDFINNLKENIEETKQIINSRQEDKK